MPSQLTDATKGTFVVFKEGTAILGNLLDQTTQMRITRIDQDLVRFYLVDAQNEEKEIPLPNNLTIHSMETGQRAARFQNSFFLAWKCSYEVLHNTDPLFRFIAQRSIRHQGEREKNALLRLPHDLGLPDVVQDDPPALAAEAVALDALLE